MGIGGRVLAQRDRWKLDIGEHPPVIADQSRPVVGGDEYASIASFVDQESARLANRESGGGAIGPEPYDVASGVEPHAAVPRLKIELADRRAPVSDTRLELGARDACRASRGVDPHSPFGILANGGDG